MRYLLLLSFSLLSHWALTQNLNGIWTGKLIQAPGGCYTEYNIELQMNFSASANTMSGKVYDYYDISKYVKLDFNGRYNANTKRMVIIENNLLESKIPEGCIPCIKTYDLNWSIVNGEEQIIGECKGRPFGSNDVCPAYKLVLKRAAKSAFTVDVEQSAEIKEQEKILHLQPREKELVKTLALDTGTIRLDFYDNAEIDGDTITVLLNNKLLLYRKMLTDKPLTVFVNAFPGTEYELVMYADNLGTIPPNTALMMVTAGDKKYEVRLSSSLQKSASIKFRYDKKH